jgi:hypothetical protein
MKKLRFHILSMIFIGFLIFSFLNCYSEKLTENRDREQILKQFNGIMKGYKDLKLDDDKITDLLNQIKEKKFGIINFNQSNLSFYIKRSEKDPTYIICQRCHIKDIPDLTNFSEIQKKSFNDNSIKVAIGSSLNEIIKNYGNEFIDITERDFGKNAKWKVIFFKKIGIQFFLDKKTNKIQDIVFDKSNKTDYIHSIHKGDKLEKVIQLYGEPQGVLLFPKFDNLHIWSKLLFQVYEKGGIVTDFRDQYEKGEFLEDSSNDNR